MAHSPSALSRTATWANQRRAARLSRHKFWQRFVAADWSCSGRNCTVLSAALAILQSVLQIDETDFILHFGDLSYAMGRGYLWETFGNLIDPFASRAPYMVSVGYAARSYAVSVVKAADLAWPMR